MNQVISCSKNHSVSSGYKRHEVPVRFFVKKEGDLTDLYKSCVFCRDANKSKRAEINAKASSSNSTDANVRICVGDRHASASSFPREEVPTHLFKKVGYPNNFFKTCLDCRRKDQEYERGNLDPEEGEFKCCRCKRIFPISEKTNGKCERCYLDQFDIRMFFNKLRLDFIKKYQSSCQKCEKIYLKPKEGTFYAQELDTFDSDHGKIVIYEQNFHFAADFIKEFEDLLEYRIIDLDHLPEDEQRARGLLLPHEMFEEKINAVSVLSKRNMTKEALKCQHVCCRCHILETISREKGISKQTPKRKYVDRIKLEIGGCQVCKRKEPNLLRFMEFDHLDPSTKIAAVTTMVGGKYSIEDIENEIKKCQLLCRHCHRIKTWPIFRYLTKNVLHMLIRNL